MPSSAQKCKIKKKKKKRKERKEKKKKKKKRKKRKKKEKEKKSKEKKKAQVVARARRPRRGLRRRLQGFLYPCRMGIIGEVAAAGYRAAPVLEHAVRVRRLYRRALKLTESWACDRVRGRKLAG